MTAGDADGERAGGHLGAVEHHGVAADDRTGADDDAVQQLGHVADEHVVLEGAALEVHDVADHAVVADDRVVDRACSAARSCPGSTCGRRSRISPLSPRSTAPGQIEASGPIVTAPMITASGWTNADESMSGSVAERVDGHVRTVPR